jgi:uncharacterized integral membrane protein (TIGR00697 family)
LNSKLALASIGLLYFVVSAAIVMACLGGKEALVALGVTLVVVINIPLAIQVSMFGAMFPLGVIPFSFLYLVEDLLVEAGSPRRGYKLAAMTAIAQLLFTAFVYAVGLYPSTSGDRAQSAIHALFGQTPRVTVAGLLATAGGFVNVWLYDRLLAWMRTRNSRRASGIAGAAIRVNLSAATGQFVNSAIFVGIAFKNVVPSVSLMILAAWIVKVLAGMLGIPVFLLGRAILRREHVSQSANTRLV